MRCDNENERELLQTECRKFRRSHLFCGSSGIDTVFPVQHIPFLISETFGRDYSGAHSSGNEIGSEGHITILRNIRRKRAFH